jgi:hypothetical protein
LNLPEFFNILKKPHSLNNCNNVIPALVLIKGKTPSKKGNENIYFPETAIISANTTDMKIIAFLMKL